MAAPNCPYLVALEQCGLELQAPHLRTTTKRRVEVVDVDTASLPDDALRYVAWDPQTVRGAFTGLDPAAEYAIEATYLAEHGIERVQSMTSGPIELHPPVRLEAGRPTVIRTKVPAEALASGTLDVSVNRIEGPDAVLSELRLYSSEPPAPIVTVAGDSAGGLVGSVSDPAYDGVAGAGVRIEWSGGRMEATTDPTGVFNVPLAEELSPGRHDRLTVTASVDGRTTVLPVDTRQLARGLRELPPEPDRIDLAGEWSFTPGPFEPETEDAGAAGPVTRVPGHVIFDGLVPDQGVATLRRSFVLPDAWTGSAVFLRCDAAYGRAEVFVNGVPAGTHSAGATSFDVDLTPYLRAGENTLAVTLTEYTPHAVLDNMSWYAHMSLLGIWRPVFLFRVPKVHLAQADLVADWDADARAGSLRVAVDVINLEPGDQEYRLGLTLSVASGAVVSTGSSGRVAGDGSRRVELVVEGLAVTPWSAEAPYLYQVDLELTTTSGAAQRYQRRAGFRRVEVSGDQLLVNGAPIRLLGVNRHDSRMLTGRALTTDQIRNDVQLLRGANVNVIRTSHYPPDPRMLDICDELGMYVFDETPICFSGGFDDHHWNRTNDAVNLIPYLVEVTAETVQRDKGHCSVITWDLGNESRWDRGFETQLAMVRRLDPTRPSMFSYDLNLADVPENLLVNKPAGERPEVRSYHYPGWDRGWQEELDWLNDLGAPVVLDEYAPLFQACIRSTLEAYTLAVDPGVRDYWVTGNQAFMAAMLQDRGCIGGMIWSAVDDVFAVPLDLNIGEGPWSHLPRADFARALDVPTGHEGTYIRGDSEWGLIDSWGRPRPELWHLQKMYSPVNVAEARFDDTGRRLTLVVVNRHAHRSLSDLRVRLHGAKGPARLAAAPGGSEEVGLDVLPGAEQVTLELFHPEGWLVDAYSWAAPGASSSPQESVVGHAEPLRVVLSPDGALTVAGTGSWLRGWPSIHLLDADRADREVGVPVPDLTSVSSDGPNAVTVALAGDEWTGSLSARVESGRVVFSYQCRYEGTGAFSAREVGLTLSPREDLTDLWWRRVGDWSYYPPAHIGRTAGYAPAAPGRLDKLQPAATWEQDTTPGGSNDYRSAKRTILAAGATDGTASLSVLSDGSQHVRAELRDGRPVLHVLDEYGGVSTVDGVHPIWSRYFGLGKRIEKGTELTGTVVVTGGALPPELRV